MYRELTIPQPLIDIDMETLKLGFECMREFGKTNKNLYREKMTAEQCLAITQYILLLESENFELREILEMKEKIYLLGKGGNKDGYDG